MADHIISDADLKALLSDLSLDEKQQQIIRKVLSRSVNTLPKAHKDAVGLAYYSALAGADTWATVNGTGTLIGLLATSIQDAGNDPREKEKIENFWTQWDTAMKTYSTKDDESMRFKAVAQCMMILGGIGILAYKYGNVPQSGFTIPIPQGAKK